MQKVVGKEIESGFTREEIGKAKVKFEEAGAKCKIFDLTTAKNLPNDVKNEQNAFILVIRNGTEALLPTKEKKISSANALLNELQNLEWDTKAKMYGRVVREYALKNV